MDFGYVPLLSAFEGSAEHRFCVGGSAGGGGVVDQPAEGAYSFSLLVCACGFGGGALVSDELSHSKCGGSALFGWSGYALSHGGIVRGYGGDGYRTWGGALFGAKGEALLAGWVLCGLFGGGAARTPNGAPYADLAY
jgi:hypothetical protein